MSFVSISLGTAKRSDLYAALQPQSIFFLPKPSAQIGPLFKQAFAQTARPGQGPLPGPNRASAQTGLLPYQMTEKIGPTIGDSSSIALAPFLRPFFTGFPRKVGISWTGCRFSDGDEERKSYSLPIKWSACSLIVPALTQTYTSLFLLGRVNSRPDLFTVVLKFMGIQNIYPKKGLKR